MAPKAPAFQFYPSDWLSSRLIGIMTPAMEGAYIRLLCYAWSDPDCSLLDDDKTLIRLSRLSETEWQEAAPILRECFVQHPTNPGRIFNARLFAEREKQEIWKRKCASGGKKSAKSRASKAESRLKGSSSLVEVYLKGSSRLVPTKAQLNVNSSSSSSSSSSSDKEKIVKRESCLELLAQFSITDDMKAWAAKEGVQNPEQFLPEFKDYWTSVGGKRKTGLVQNWDATFRNHIRRLKLDGRIKVTELKPKRFIV